MNKGDGETTIQSLKDMVIKFRDERDWKRHHSPKNLAISISIEAGELLEHFQWDEYSQIDKQAISDELADVFFNLLNFADRMDIDISRAFLDKFERVEEKYPLSLFNKDSLNKDAYFAIKKAYRKKENKL